MSLSAESISVSASTSIQSNKNDSYLYSAVYKSVSKFLMDPSENPQKIEFSTTQVSRKIEVSITIEELSKEEAIQSANSKHFESAFAASENRREIRNACNKARIFYKEHILTKNPFPPRQKFSFNCVGGMKRRHKKQKSPDSESSSLARTLSSCSLVSSHSSTNLKFTKSETALKNTAKKRENLHDSSYLRTTASNKKANNPIMGKDERRFVNTLNSSDY